MYNLGNKSYFKNLNIKINLIAWKEKNNFCEKKIALQNLVIKSLKVNEEEEEKRVSRYL